MIRKAEERDYEQLVSLARIFTVESDLPLTYNEARTRKTIWEAMHRSDTDLLVSEQDDVVNGAALVIYEAQYYDETCAYVDKLFVHKELRGYGVADELLEEALAKCHERNVRLIFASATAGMGERVEKLYVRLFERHGFFVLGRIIMRAL